MPRARRIDRSNPDQVPEWAVVGQEQDTTFVADPSVQPDWLVHYETRSGIIGTVRIPHALYTPEYVAAEVAAIARRHEEVSGLRSDGRNPR